MKTVANLFAQTYVQLGSDHQSERHFVRLARLMPEEDSHCTFVKRVEGLAQHEYWIAREKNILMLLKRTPHVVRLRKEEKTDDSYQTIKTKEAGISLAYWLRTKPRLANSEVPLQHPFVHAHSFLQLAKSGLTALKDIHEAGVIHSQLRADNICIPYHPHPYQFDAALNIDINNLTLIDFMFAVSHTLRLSRHIPINIIDSSPSTQSKLLKQALYSDKEKRQADAIQNIDYSVDLYALGFILQQIFQKNLIYPQGLEAELSMGIHRIITQLLSYDEGIPNAIKIRYLTLFPHKDYLHDIEQLLEISQQGQASTAINLLFDPAQCLEEDILFSFTSPIIDNNNQAADLDIGTPPQPAMPLLNQPSFNPIESVPMTDRHTNTASDHIELSKVTVISLLVSLQSLYVIYTDGNAFGLDVMSSMALIIIIAGGIIGAKTLFNPPKPLPKPLFTDDDEPLSESSTQAAPILASYAQSTHEASTEEADNTAPAIILLKSNSSPKKEEDPIELNKWLVIAVIVVLQFGYMLYSIDFKGTAQTTAPTEDTASTTTEAPIAEEPLAEPLPAEAAPTDIASETPPTNTATTAANIELLSEASSVKTPEITPKPVKNKATPDASSSMLLSGSTAVAPKTTVKKEKVAKTDTPKTEETKQTAIPLTKEQAVAADKTPVPIDVSAPKEVAPPPAETTKNTEATVEATAEAKTPAPSPKSLTRGLAEAQNVMGWSYYHGNKVKQDYEEAFKWFSKAANLGEASAQFNVGMMYQKGEGTKQDLNEAAKWYRKSAEQGKASAQLNLGMMYISGRGIRQNLEEGKKWLTKAADQGDMTAKANLSWLIQQGYTKDAPSGE